MSRLAGSARASRLKVILGVLTFGICLSILELGIRVDDWRRSRRPADPPLPLSLLQANPMGTGSYRLRPNLDLETRIGSQAIRIRTNSHGMHWRETSLQGDGRARVAFLGDSFTFGSWASDVSKSFVGVFESVVGPTRFEALNFGVGGYGLLDEELIFREVAAPFGPSYVVVMVYNGNDFRDTWLGLNREQLVDGTAQLNEENLKARIPPPYLVDDNTRALDCATPVWRQVAGRSAAFRRLAPLLDLEDLCVRFKPNLNFTMPGFWSLTPPPEITARAAGEVLASLSRMEALAAAGHARLAVVAIPTADQVYALSPTGRNFDTGLPQSALGTFCSERRVPYLDLLPVLREQAARSNRRLYLKNDTHFNDFGHQRVGEAIASWFLSRVKRDRPSSS